MTDGTADGGDTPEGVGDQREKHVTVVTASNARIEHGDVFLRHATDAFLVSPEAEFPPEETERYAKSEIRSVEITQHHSACFITTATAGEGPTLDSLRGFRDDALARTPVGRGLVAVYYAVSPPVADTLARHPESRTARVVRWFVERCGTLARRRADADAPATRLGLSALLTLSYAVGLLLAVTGHAAILLRERFADAA